MFKIFKGPEGPLNMRRRILGWFMISVQFFGLQDPQVPVHICHNAWAINVRINCLWDNRNPLGVEGQSLDRLTLLSLHGSRVSYSLPWWLLKEQDIIKVMKLL